MIMESMIACSHKGSQKGEANMSGMTFSEPMDSSIPCPDCDGTTWYETSAQDVVCGACGFVATQLDSAPWFAPLTAKERRTITAMLNESWDTMMGATKIAHKLGLSAAYFSELMLDNNELFIELDNAR